jgi:hypothetical protein
MQALQNYILSEIHNIYLHKHNKVQLFPYRFDTFIYFSYTQSLFKIPLCKRWRNCDWRTI